MKVWSVDMTIDLVMVDAREASYSVKAPVWRYYQPTNETIHEGSHLSKPQLFWGRTVDSVCPLDPVPSNFFFTKAEKASLLNLREDLNIMLSRPPEHDPCERRWCRCDPSAGFC
jgi:hypothetical protein